MFLTTPKKHPGAGVTTTKKHRGRTKLQVASVAAAVAQAGHDQLLGSCAAVRCSPGMHSTCQAAGQLSQHTRLPPLWHLATRRCCPHWQRLQERAICPHQRSLFSLLLQKFEKSSRKWRFLEESCPLPARHKPRSSRAFWPPKHPGDLNFFWLPRKNIVENQKTTKKKIFFSDLFLIPSILFKITSSTIE